MGLTEITILLIAAFAYILIVPGRWRGWVLLVGSIVVFSLGMLIVSPMQQGVLASLANPAALGSYFGVSSLSLAFGGALGSWGGGVLYGFAQQHALPMLPWFEFAAVGILATTGLVVLSLAHARRIEPLLQPGEG